LSGKEERGEIDRGAPSMGRRTVIYGTGTKRQEKSLGKLPPGRGGGDEGESMG